MQKITPFIWFDSEAEEAAKFYTALFLNSKLGEITHYDAASAEVSGQPEGSVLTVDFTLNGQQFGALNGGPIFPLNPSVSLYVHCNTAHDVDTLFEKLSEGGEVMMELGKYPFNERFAFFKDKYGVSWQLLLSPGKQHIAPCLLFVGESLGSAEAAVNLYTAIFKDAKINHMMHYKGDDGGKKGTVMHSSFMLEGQEFIAMDGEGPHNFAFNESMSFVVNCKDQDEVDYYWDKFTEEGRESQCGWLKDKFGVSWQIVPTRLQELLSDPDKAKAGRVMQAMLQMKKIDIADLEAAAKQ